jgi:hypothetical protein
MSVRRSLLCCAVLAGLLAGLAGCSSSAPPRGKVRGRVTLGPTPLSNATIYFDDGAGGGVGAPLGPDGSYEVKTYRGEGLPAGTYKVTLSPGRIMEPGEKPPPAAQTAQKPPGPNTAAGIPEKFRQASSTPLTIKVEAGDNQPFDFDLLAH